MTTYQEVLDELFSMHRFSVHLGLKNISNLLEKLGNPQNKSKTIHVAGTNGKGSTCAFIDSILRTAGYNVGVFTSPHLVDFRERIRFQGKKISKESFVAAYDTIKPFLTNQTFFEVLTAIAFVYFSKEKIDFLIVEVGLGGRLDATNVITPLMSIITSIALDHSKYLGTSIKEVAFEKAGIIKQDVPLIIPANINGIKTIEEVAKKQSAPIKKIIFKHAKKSSLKGSFQEQNQALALAAIKELPITITEESIQKGLAKTYWPGRFEFIKKNVLVDCAHNAAAVKMIVAEVKKVQKDFSKTIVLTGIMKDKDYDKMIPLFESVADELVLVQPSLERAATTKELAKHTSKPHTSFQSVKEGVQETIKKLKEDELLFISGSIFTVGESFNALALKPFDS